ncbi:hypothetical protein MVEN_01420800 [Mycena venus]|uniref:Extracellular serine-rich protein n=1 Tax=Mycena venus TaxID=2733690 RepID=A0A8H6XZ91_9AGAR|nr:hypothetical protein MVEN_01420800 [Mycena venus]
MSVSGPDPPVIVNVSANNGTYQFIPPIIHASNGTVVSFQFSGIPGNHSVTQSSFASPCQPLANGFDSGFIAAREKTDGTFPTFNLTVTNDQNAMWFYCRQQTPTSHCNSGMVGVINGVKTRFQTFQDKAQNSHPTSSAQGAAVSNVSDPKPSVPIGAIIGATIGTLLLVVLCVIGVVLRRRRRHHARLEGMRPDPLITYEKGPFPPENGVTVLSAILREVRSLRTQMRPGGASTSASSPPSDCPPPKYTISS